MDRRALSAAQGFTLIELLVATAVLAVLGVMTATLVSSSLANQSAIKQRATELQEVALAINLLRRDLEQLSIRGGRDAFGDLREFPLEAAKDNTLLRFTRRGRRQLPGGFQGSVLQHVRYALEDGTLMRYSSPVADPLVATPQQAQPLLGGLDGIGLRLYDGKTWHQRWPDPDSEARIPRAVHLLIDSRRFGELQLKVLLPGDSQ